MGKFGYWFANLSFTISAMLAATLPRRREHLHASTLQIRAELSMCLVTYFNPTPFPPVNPRKFKLGLTHGCQADCPFLT